MKANGQAVENVMRSATRPRQTVKIFLELTDPEDIMLLELFFRWKKKRKFSPNIKLASKLFAELERGSTELLYETFPWLVNQPEAMEEDMSNIELFAKLRDIFNDNTPRLPAPERPLELPEPTKAETPAKRQSLSDASVGDLLEVQSAPKTAPSDKKWNVPYCNLQLGLYGLGSIKHLSELADEVLEYGIYTGKLPAAKARKVLADRHEKKSSSLPEAAPIMAIFQPIEIVSSGNARPIAGAERPLAAPTFDDDLDDLL